MGACQSITGGGDSLVIAPDGNQKKYRERFLEEDVLGQGEFGVVKRVREASRSEVRLACKSLRKGFVFKDNQLYPPLPTAMLLGEIEMLRALRVSTNNRCKSDNFCLQLHSVYETPKEILIVTELCQGGDMLEYVARQETDLRTEDISRIAYQLLQAVDHCAQHKIIHRDITPQNIMFQDASPQSPLRLIDFGAGALDTEFMASLRSRGSDAKSQLSPLGRHTTFAGTPFYNSPEMFQKRYTQKTDIFSIGVTLYVLSAGYPADQLQKAFNILQRSSKGHSESRDLKQLPNLPQNMPASYYDMLEDLLVYQPRDRKTAHEMLSHPFVTFHQDLLLTTDDDDQELVSATTQSDNKRPSIMLRRQSMALEGSLDRHNMMLSYKQFERSLTTLLATTLDNADLILLVNIMRSAVGDDGDEDHTGNNPNDETLLTIDTAESFNSFSSNEASPDTDKLGVIRVYRLIRIVEEDLFHHDV